MAKPRAMPGLLSGLSIKIVAIIVLVILAVELIIFLPSAASVRQSWLADRLRVGIVALRVLDAVPDVLNIPTVVTDRLLNSAGAIAIVYRREGQSQLIALEGVALPREVVTADTRERGTERLVVEALDTLLFGGERTLRILGEDDAGREVEVLTPEAPLRAELLRYSRNLLFLSLILAAITSTALYVFLAQILIGPIRRISGNMVAFRQAPENASLIVPATERRDEIGVLQDELSAMETDIYSMLRQRKHLADLGLAVAKINHDLRNSLTSAQLLSDQVANVDDPKVQRLAPRLVNTIDKAIGFAQQVLDYGRQSTAPPRPVPVDLHELIDESALDAGLTGHPTIRFRNLVPDDVAVRVDPDQFARVFVNLMKNAREAMELAGDSVGEPEVTVGYEAVADGLTLSFADNGPGLPPRAKENLFVAFEGSARSGGTGLGLSIARELVEAHGGRIGHVEEPRGARFDIWLPAALRLP